MLKIKNSQVIDVTLTSDVDNFDHTGHISGVGMEAVWYELNRIVCRIDRDRDEEGKIPLACEVCSQMQQEDRTWIPLNKRHRDKNITQRRSSFDNLSLEKAYHNINIHH